MNREAERKRLVELISKIQCRNSECAKSCSDCSSVALFDEDVEILADHILDDGWMRPPVKVGDKVYVVSQGQGFNMRWDIYEGKVTDIHINCHNELEIRAENGEKFFGYYKPCFVFTSREEAQKALEGSGEK